MIYVSSLSILILILLLVERRDMAFAILSSTVGMNTDVNLDSLDAIYYRTIIE